jgi:predicted  nucleic acid-binding Zn-ribbon protein
MKTKDEYVRDLHQKIEEWNRDIDKLIAELDSVDEKSRAELQENIRMLKDKRDSVQQKVAELNKSGSEAWEDLKSGADLAWEAMNVAIKSATNRFFR